MPRRKPYRTLNLHQQQRIQSRRRAFAANRNQHHPDALQDDTSSLAPADSGPVISADARTGRIISNYGMNSEVEDEQGKRYRCTIRETVAATPAAGDRVIWLPSNDTQGVIEAVLPRTSELRRPASQGRLQTVAANIDQLIVLFSVDHFSMGLADRYIVAASAAGIDVALVVNKCDLLKSDEFREYRAWLKKDLRVYRRIGYTAKLISVQDGNGLRGLTRLLAGRTSLIAGRSGVGKSSVIRHLVGDETIRIGALTPGSGRGRQTTAISRLYALPGGGSLIDSAGIRALGLQGITPQSVITHFREISQRLGRCRFLDCHHRTEPGCVILKAVKKGKIDVRRLDSMHRILDSLPNIPGALYRLTLD
jgi:ribosome biogenesis GTPase